MMVAGIIRQPRTQRPQNPSDMSVQSPEPPLLVGLRLDVYLSPQLLQTDRSFYHASLPRLVSKDVSHSRAPSLRKGYVVPPLITTPGSSATPSPLSPLRLPTYRAYHAPVFSNRDEKGFPSWPHASLSVSPLIPRHRPRPLLCRSRYKDAAFDCNKRLGPWNSPITRLQLRSLPLRPR